MRILLRILAGLGGILVLLIVALLLAPLLFKDRILQAARDQIGRQVNATVDFKDADVSLLTSFPVLELDVHSLSIVGQGEFEGERLLDTDDVVVGIDVWKLATANEILIKRVLLRRPVVQLIVKEDGSANYNIAKPSEAEPTATEGDAIALRIDDYAIENGDISYRTPGLAVRVSGLYHQGTAVIDGAQQNLVSSTNAEALTVESSGTKLLNEAKTALNLDARIDGDAQALTLKTAKLDLNALGLAVAGQVQWGGPAVRLALRAESSDQASIKALMSTLPAAYTKDFAKLSADGKFSINAEVDGALAGGAADLPPLSAALKVEDGRFQYPDHPLPVTDLQLDVSVEHPGGPLDKATVRAPKLAFRAGQTRATGRLTATRLGSDPRVDVKLDGDVNLQDIERALPVAGMQALSGRLKFDVEMVGSAKKIERLVGTIDGEKIKANSADAPPIEVKTAKVRLTDRQTFIDDLSLTSKSSDIKIQGAVSPLSSMLLADAPIKGDLTLTSRQLIVSDFTSDTKAPPAAEESTDAPAPEPKNEPSPVAIPDRLDAKLKLDIGRLDAQPLELAELKGTASVKKGTLTLGDIRAKGLGGRMKVDGAVKTSPTAPPAFDLTYALSNAGFKDTFNAVGAVQSLAPIANHLTGRYGTEFAVKGRLGDDFGLDLSALDVDGFVATVNSRLTNYRPLNALSDVIPRIKSPLKFNDTKAFFTVENGAVKVKPFKVAAAGLNMQVQGTHGLNQQMRYSLETELPIKEAQQSALVNKLKTLSKDITKLTKVKVAAIVSGSVTDPKVSFDVSLPGAGEIIQKAVGEQVKKATEKVTKRITAEAAKIIAEAEKRADAIRKEAAQAALRVEQKGDREANAVEKKAGSNPLLKLGAGTAANEIRKQSRQAAKKLVDEAESQAKAIVDQAKAQAANLK